MLRHFYIAAVLSWMFSVILVPPWVGTLKGGGVFGLEGATGSPFRVRAPLWKPPKANGDGLDETVRWPLTFARSHAFVEVDRAAVIGLWSVGIMLLGLLFRMATWGRPSAPPDAVLETGWHLSIGLFLAWFGYLVLAAFSSGYGATGPIKFLFLSAGTTVGLLWGRAARKLARLSEAVFPRPPKAQPSPTAEDQSRAVRRDMQVLGGVLGIALSVAIAAVTGAIASRFRGPVAGFSELGTPLFARDQQPVDFTAGMVILVIGGLLGGPSLFFPKSRGLAIGILAASTVLGVMFILRH